MKFKNEPSTKYKFQNALSTKKEISINQMINKSIKMKMLYQPKSKYILSTTTTKKILYQPRKTQKCYIN